MVTLRCSGCCLLERGCHLVIPLLMLGGQGCCPHQGQPVLPKESLSTVGGVRKETRSKVLGCTVRGLEQGTQGKTLRCMEKDQSTR